MGELRCPRHNERGFSLIEIMIAGALIGFIAVAVLPAVFSVADSARASGFRSLCTSAVHAKLQEYVNGVADDTIGANFIPTGFEYSRSRYQTYQSSCSLSPSTASPGFRESVYSNQPTSGHEVVPGTSTTAIMDGFQLWVMLRAVNPRKLTSGLPTRWCPPSTHQFLGLGDAIEVTVTGMVRTDTALTAGGRARSGTPVPVGKLRDVSGGPNPLLTCASTTIVYPPRLPFRYFLAPDGRIRNYQAALAFASGAAGASKEGVEAHFRSVWVQGASSTYGAPAVAGIRSFAVAPNNRWIYILKPGQIERYGPCYDTPTTVYKAGVATTVGGTVTVDSKSFDGVPDCLSRPTVNSYSNNPGPDGGVWNFEAVGIESIAVDFGADKDDNSPADHKVYGFSPQMASLQSDTSKSGLMLATLGSSGPPYTITWAETTAFRLPKDLPRMRGMFMAQTPLTGSGGTIVPNLFFFDNTCFTGGSTSVGDYSYCTTIYSGSDAKLQQEMRELPMTVEAISF